MLPSMLNPYIRLATHSVISVGQAIMRRVIYDYELIYIEHGSVNLVYNDIAYHCTENDIIFIRPGIAHSFDINECDISQPHIHFDMTYRTESEKIPISFKDIGAMTQEERSWIHKDYFYSYPVTPFVKLQSPKAFLDIFYGIINEKRSVLMQKALMIQLLAMLIDDNFPDFLNVGAKISVASRIKDYIDSGNAFLMELDDFAKHFYHSKFYLEKTFKEAYGIGLIKYRNRKRMMYADELLEKYSVSQVANELGYQSIYSFSRAYKEYCGIAPSKRIKRN